MRKDRHPDNSTESASPPDYHRDPPEEDAPPSLMAYPSLETLQQRLDTFEDRFIDQNQQDDRTLVSRIARVAPMSAATESTRDRQIPTPHPGAYNTTIPSFPCTEVAASVSASVAATTATTSAAASVAASFAPTTSAAAVAGSSTAWAARTVAGSSTAGAARTVTGSYTAGAARTGGIRSAVHATGWNTPYSPPNASATSYTATYASSRGRYITNYIRPIEPVDYQQYLYCVASTSRGYPRHTYNPSTIHSYAAGSHSSPVSGSSSASRSAATLAASNLNPEAPIFRPRYLDAEMPSVSEPRKVAKRSEQHTSVKRNDDIAVGHGGHGDDDDEDMDIDI
ncbi:PREDICTED: side tail fiber protein homolog from lambdoid prophage Rac-like [Diuraphis noxia]|uniref:side tail fiber protein homolog from lambdoid prophage Rac-like n=1 Tax=Diuraphis noxia TaxID=143948 RepID=UPI000763AADB|nr:PREDICTED: side tail fiber protein homolog from lambdoid prophage Rac-like [Diuraphis noxia]